MSPVTFDADAWAERAAIMEFDGGMTRFAAETAAAKAQGVARWQAIREAENAKRSGSSGGYGHSPDPVDRKRDANDLPGMQRQPEEKNRPVPERQPEAGRDRGVLSSLRGQHGSEVQR